MRTEVQQQLIAAYEALVTKRAAIDAALVMLRQSCLDYGLNEHVLGAVQEQARRNVASSVPDVVQRLQEAAMERQAARKVKDTHEAPAES